MRCHRSSEARSTFFFPLHLQIFVGLIDKKKKDFFRNLPPFPSNFFVGFAAVSSLFVFGPLLFLMRADHFQVAVGWMILVWKQREETPLVNQRNGSKCAPVRKAMLVNIASLVQLVSDTMQQLEALSLHVYLATATSMRKYVTQTRVCFEFPLAV